MNSVANALTDLYNDTILEIPVETPETMLVDWYSKVLSWVWDYLTQTGFKKVKPNRNVRDAGKTPFTVYEAELLLNEGRKIFSSLQEPARRLVMKKTTVDVSFDAQADLLVVKNDSASLVATAARIFAALKQDHAKGSEWERKAYPLYEDPNLDYTMQTCSRSDREKIEVQLRELIRSARTQILTVDPDVRVTLFDVLRGEDGGDGSDEEGWEGGSDSDDDRDVDMLDADEDAEGAAQGLKRRRGEPSSSPKKRRKAAKPDAAKSQPTKAERQQQMLARNRAMVERRQETLDSLLAAKANGTLVAPPPPPPSTPSAPPSPTAPNPALARFLRTEEPKKIRDKTRFVFENALYNGHACLKYESPSVVYCVMMAFEIEAEIHAQFPGDKYSSKVRSLKFNLEDSTNPLVVARVLSGKISVKELVKMTSEDMASASVKKMREEAREEALKDRAFCKVEDLLGGGNKTSSGNTQSEGISRAAVAAPTAPPKPPPLPPSAENASAAALAAAGISSSFATASWAIPAADESPDHSKSGSAPSSPSSGPSAPRLPFVPSSPTMDLLDEEDPPAPAPDSASNEVRTAANIFDVEEFAALSSSARYGKYKFSLPSKDGRSPNIEFSSYLLLARNGEDLENRRPILDREIPNHSTVVGRSEFGTFDKFFRAKMKSGKYMACCVKISTASCSPQDKADFKKFYKELESVKRVAVCKSASGSTYYIVPPKFATQVPQLRHLGCTNSNNKHVGVTWLLYYCKVGSLKFRAFDESDNSVAVGVGMGEAQCRFCLETCPITELISPCGCTGSAQYVHLSCLRRWQTTTSLSIPNAPSLLRRDREGGENRHSKCSSCQQEFSMQPPTQLELLASKLRPSGCLTKLGMDPISAEGRDTMLLSIIVASRKMSSSTDNLRRAAASNSSPFSPSPLPPPSSAAPSDPPAPQPHGGPQRTGVISALLALVELKKAHWSKGLYFIFHVGPSAPPRDPSPEPPHARDVIQACNLSRFIHSSSTSTSSSSSSSPSSSSTSSSSPSSSSPSEPHEGTPDNVLSDFSSRGLLPDPATGCYKSATVIARHHNGGPVNWSSAHNGYLLVANRSATSLRATLREAFGDLADVGEQAVLRGVAAMDAGEQRNGVALVFAEFSLLHDRVLPLLQDN
ncbi:hypothetical protein TeGR_g8389 [Tetraparma gracilis]|uniref:RING-CH-type domain-containing protein n=1 Tax=Tetraparma gracilis TaxID=2962635 RepID=A0ABQ6M9F8_9STRA|nr:hypothetical protein TeGR_g8389 [Tetraparma gracilis]